jgi:AcrR family transcriptional regulator
MNKHSKNNAEATRKTLRKEREREGHQQAILRAAESVFARKGFHDATIEEIARESGYSVGTLYNFFKNKDDLYTRVIFSHHEEFTRRFDAVLAAGKGAIETLGGLLDLSLAHFTLHQAFVRLFFQSSEGTVIRSMPAEIRRFHLHYSESLHALFKRGVQSGELIPLDPQLLTFCYEGFISAMIRYWAMGDFKEPLSALSEKARHTFSTILRTQGTPP